ncbi:MAG: TRAP transporter small permease subunit [Thiomargarita sp.]|nr:TRAP transporter small permease subunit [Thiomargarita sp.]
MPIQVLFIIKYIIHIINQFSDWTGRVIAWLLLLMVLIIVYQASMASLFSIGSVALQELQWHLFALIFLLGSAYTLKYDEHVRVDVFYQSSWMNERRRAWVNFLGSVFFLLPFCLIIMTASWTFVFDAYTYQESSSDPGGLPYRFLLKAAIPIGFLLLMLQGIANSLTSLLVILDIKEP